MATCDECKAKGLEHGVQKMLVLGAPVTLETCPSLPPNSIRIGATGEVIRFPET